MSLGNTYNNNQDQQKQWHPTVYSPYRFNNAESAIDQTCLTFSFWKNILRITISPRKATGNDEIQFDMDNGISIYLNHTKSRILAEEIRKFMANPEAYDNGAGVPSGQGIITICNGKEYGSPTPCLTIRKIDENGSVLSEIVYEFKTDYYFAIRNYDAKSAAFDKVSEDYKDIEIYQMLTLLDEYVKAITGAVAYTVIDQQKFENTRMNNKLIAIAQKLGVDLQTSSGKRSYSSSSNFFNNAQSSTPSTQYTQGGIEDLEE